MNTAPLTRGRLIALAGTVAVAALALAGCDSTGATPPASNAPSGPASTAPTGPAGVAADVAAYEAPLASWPIPTAPVSNKDALKGKTVYYIPITLQAPQFGTTQTGLTEALKSLGANIQVCDGQGNPTAIAACVNQATQGRAAAIIADAIQYELAGTAFDAAQAAGIPIVIGDQAPSTTHPDSKTLATLAGEVGDAMDEAAADWVVNDAQGPTNVLANVGADGASPALFFQAAQKVYDANQATVTVNKVSTGSFQLVAPSTSAALLKDPTIKYLHIQFGQYLQASEGGVKAAGLFGKVKLVTTAAQLGELQAVAAGDLSAASSPSAVFEGWIFADAALRMVAGDQLPAYTVPMRLFTANNIGSVDLTQDAMNSGAWYGPKEPISAGFEKLWGVN